jgi:hypothetical protein
MNPAILSLISIIRRKAMISVIIALTVFLVTASMMRRSGACLKSSEAPRAIISFELAFTSAKAANIKREWDSKECDNGVRATEMAIKNTNQDLLFIFGYTSLLIVLAIIFPRKRDPQYDLFILKLAGLAAICDVIENVFMLIYLQGGSMHPLFFGAFASAKFLMLIFIVLNIVLGIARSVSYRSLVD